MAKMFSLTQIIMPGDVIVPKGKVFTCTPEQAKQFDALNAARVATPAEIENADREQAAADGHEYVPSTETKAPPSGAPGDPLAVPKSK